MLLLHTKTKQIRLGNDEVEILVVDLSDLLRGACCCCLCGKLFQRWPRDRGEEVEVGRAVKPLLKVVRDGFQVRGSRLDQVYGWDIGDGGSLGRDVPWRFSASVYPNVEGAGTAHMCIVTPIDLRSDT